LGLVSIENKDLHTHRSAEVPAIGTAFSAQRTSQHLAMYDEGVEAVFWDDADECARVCLALLSDPAKLKQVAERGHQRVVKDRNFNEPLMERVVRETLTFVGSRAKDGQRS
jgi:hypothetical protein